MLLCVLYVHVHVYVHEQIIIGSIVIKSRDSDTARAALIELNLAVGLFEKAARNSDRARRSLVSGLALCVWAWMRGWLILVSSFGFLLVWILIR